MTHERKKDGPETAQANGAKAPSFSVQQTKEGTLVRIGGEWTALTVGGIEKSFMSKVASLGKGRVSMDLGNVTRLDTTGALFLKLAFDGADVKVAAEDEQHKRLFKLADEVEGHAPPPASTGNPLARFVNDLGKAIVEESRLAVQLVGFLGEYLVTVARVVLKPKMLPLTSLVYHMQQVGVSAVPIVALLSFLIGLVIAYMGAQQLSRFGVDIFVVDLVQITTLRELGVLLTSIVIAGRSGSSFTAQIGAMVANEEVAAMRTMGLSPMNRLTFPRVTALVLMLPALVFLADIMGILGGSVAVWTIMDMTPSAYAARMQESISTANFVVGMVKAPFFAVVIGIIGCFQGFQVTGSAESVGRLTTHSVVEAIFMVIVLDALFAIFFMGLGV